MDECIEQHNETGGIHEIHRHYSTCRRERAYKHPYGTKKHYRYARRHSAPIEFVVVGEMLILQRYRGACAIIGKISRRNISLANGQIKVHPKEVKQLIKELKEYLGKNRLI